MKNNIMKLQDKINNYKKTHKNTSEHVFKDGTQLKGKLHTWIDNCYLDAVNEFKTLGTKNTANWLDNLLR